MVVLLGGSGYIGQAFQAALKERGLKFETWSRQSQQYTSFALLLERLKENKPDFVINAAGFTGRPNVDACEQARAETLLGNTLFPQSLAQACWTLGIPWGHVSSGCIYNGAWVREKEGHRIETDTATLLAMAEYERDNLIGFSEEDEPNFSFRKPPCSFYSGCKALAEESLKQFQNAYVWRLRIPFDEYDNGRNYLTKLQSYPKVYNNLNSLSHRGEFVNACLDLWQHKAPFGIYNLTNPGFVTTKQVVKMMQKNGVAHEFKFWESDEQFYKEAAVAPRSNCVLNIQKAASVGIKMTPVEECLDSVLHQWKQA